MEFRQEEMKWSRKELGEEERSPGPSTHVYSGWVQREALVIFCLQIPTRGKWGQNMVRKTRSILLPFCGCLVSKSCLTLCDPVDCSPPSSSVHGIFQARMLKWAAISSSRASSPPRDRTQVSCIGKQILYHQTMRKDLSFLYQFTFIRVKLNST